MTDPKDEDPLLGAIIADKYRVDRCIGRGGMGAVYQATHLAINKRVALKFLEREAAADAGAVARFQREAQAAGLVESAHIVEIYDAGTTALGRPYLVMELLRGEDLRALLRREGRLPTETVTRMAAQVLRALGRAHAAGIVHRDLKPDNVFLCERDDEELFVKLVDFGISKLTAGAHLDTLTNRGVVLGTAFYMAPEQAQASPEIDGRADIYSLGAIVYEALSGRPPHTGRVYEAVLVAACTKDAEDVRLHAPGVPEPLARIVARALERDPNDRWPHAEAMLQALADHRLAAVTTSPTHPPQVTEPPVAASVPSARASAIRTAPGVTPARRRRITWVASIVAVAALFAGAAFLLAPHTGGGVRAAARPSSPDPSETSPSTVSERSGTKESSHSAADASRARPTDAKPDAEVTAPTPAKANSPHRRPLQKPPAAVESSAPPRSGKHSPAPGVAPALELETDWH